MKDKLRPERFRPSRAERRKAGKALRDKVPRSSHGAWKPDAKRPSALSLLKISDRDRVHHLLPLRYGRMSHSSLAFLRGAASVMSADLAKSPASGIRVQACGDAHLMNFGEFATPERHLVFDVNDFDETLIAPWEWDLKRLAASFAVAARAMGFPDGEGRDAAREVSRSYRERTAEYAEMSNLDIWYARIDSKTLIKMKEDADLRKRWEKAAAQARTHTVEHAFPRFAHVVNERWRISDEPPLILHSKRYENFRKSVVKMLRSYRLTIQEDRRALLDRYRVVDVAVKVVGVGSVGTRCGVVLLMASEHDPLFLQIKEARSSVLEPYAGGSPYPNHGQRVVDGQRLMQAASDLFLGWARDDDGHDFYFRQLRDMKSSPKLKGMFPSDLIGYADVCGWALARSHAKSGLSPEISGYLGKSDVFDRAIASFSIAYADQTEKDYKSMMAAIKKGHIQIDQEGL